MMNRDLAELLFAIEAALPFVDAEVGDKQCGSDGGPSALKSILKKYDWDNERWKWLGLVYQSCDA